MIALHSGRLRLALAPELGGSIAEFVRVGEGKRDWPVLRSQPRAPADALDCASFPLVPFVNRVREGSFDFRGRRVELEPNMAGDPSPLHGQGWRERWAVESASESRASLTYNHPAGEWPWRYAARQDFALDPDGLSLTLSCTNIDEAPMPCGLGQHPYFHCGPLTRIATGVTHAWTIDERVLPVEQVPAKGRFDLSDRLVCGQGLDHGFGGWSGSARLSDPDWPMAIRLSSPQARFFQLYSPESGRIFVAEPVTHANAALNRPEAEWAELGLRTLDPGETMQLEMRIALEPAQATG